VLEFKGQKVEGGDHQML